MSNEVNMRIIARVHTDFKTKFGIPRQSTLVEGLTSKLIFEKEFRDENAVRGLEMFSHIWLIWQFSENVDKGWSPTVRPPRLGGNERIGVFATRSPFRPNPIGLSCARVLGIEHSAENGTILHLGGIDLMDGTPILDIKPYIPYADCIPEASEGYTGETIRHRLRVNVPAEYLKQVADDKQRALIGVLEQDPRPSYQNDPKRIYGLEFAGMNVRFCVCDDELTVVEVRHI